LILTYQRTALKPPRLYSVNGRDRFAKPGLDGRMILKGMIRKYVVRCSLYSSLAHDKDIQLSFTQEGSSSIQFVVKEIVEKGPSAEAADAPQP
jgi:hypothetical protein